MKHRFTFLDIRAIINELNLQSTYIQNIYSPLPRCLVLKLNTCILVFDIGIRFNLTGAYEPGPITHFCAKMRKLKRQKIKSISQVGFDRVVKLELTNYYVYFEFFASGNVVICSLDNVIVELYRPVKELNVVKGEVYVTNPVRLRFGLGYKFVEMIGLEKELAEVEVDRYKEFLRTLLGEDDVDMIVNGLDEKSKQGGEDKVGDFNLANNDKQANNNLIAILTDYQLQAINNYFEDLLTKLSTLKNYGCVTYQKSSIGFYPMKPKLKSNQSLKEFDTFNLAVDFFYKKEAKQEKGKVTTVRDKQKSLIEELKAKIADFDFKINWLHENETLIQEIFIIHNNVCKYKLSWKDFERQKGCDERMRLVKVSDFKNGIVVVKPERVNEDEVDFENNLNDETKENKFKDEDKFKDEKQKTKQKLKKMKKKQSKQLEIELNFTTSFNTNITNLYALKKKQQQKLNKTLENIDRVVKLVEKKEGKIKKNIVKRKKFWFEKFNFAFTSTKQLILAGKNAQQNETLVKKYLERGDFYFHCEIQGGASVILKNGNKFTNVKGDNEKNDNDNINFNSKNIERQNYEAAVVALCLSKCWSKKIISPVYFVESEQVSKQAESGEFLSKGSFMVRGKKRYVDVIKMEYGIGLLFKLKKETDGDDDNEQLDKNVNFGDKTEVKDCDKIVKGVQNLKLNNSLDKNKDSSYDKNLAPSNDLKELAKFDFVTHPVDTNIEFCFVVAGPWDVIKTYKYKEKLMPGVNKKSKIAAEVLKRFNKEARRENEAGFVKGLLVEEVVDVLLNDVKIGKWDDGKK